MSSSRTSVRTAIVCLSLACIVGSSARNASAQDESGVAQDVTQIARDENVLPQLRLEWIPTEIDDAVHAIESSPARRPAALIPLYASFVAVQALDMSSSFAAFDKGAVEANPLLRGVVGSKVGFSIVKASEVGATIFLVERIWRRHRTLAIITMVGVNSAYATIAAHNYAIARQ